MKVSLHRLPAMTWIAYGFFTARLRGFKMSCEFEQAAALFEGG
jgi:hypothetical protein